MEQSIEKQQDELAREAIRYELGTSFFVEAGAGSGKTSILVERMVNMVKFGIPVSKICAITFTKAAASEFYARFKAALEKEAQFGDKVCAGAVRDIDLCFMGTIDSFCQMVLGEHPATASLPSGMSVISDSEAESEYLRYFSEVQRGVHGSELFVKSAFVRKLFGRSSEQVFVHMAQVMAERRNAAFRYNRVEEANLDELFAESRKRIRTALEYICEHKEKISNENSASTSTGIYLFENRHRIYDSWDASPDDAIDFLEGLKALRLLPDTQIGDMELSASLFEPHYTRSRLTWYEFSEEYTAIIEDIENYRFAFLEGFVEDCLSGVTEEMRREGKLTFFDYQLYLAETLRKDAMADGKLIRHIYDRHSFFLIDEFQDTNPLQAEIFFYLSAEKLDADWRKCIPYGGSLFIVGDPKQSIYRFRSADVNSYQRVKELFTGNVGRAVVLACNFRSTLEVCDWFNRTFEDLLPSDTPDQSHFDRIPLDGKENYKYSFGGIYKYSHDTKLGADTSALKIIKTLVGNPEMLITGKGESEPRQIRYSDFMLITPTKTRIYEYARLFAENGIPFKVEGSAKFSECDAFRGLVRIYEAVASPNDRNALYGALTCGAFGISDYMLSEYVACGNKLNVFECSDDGSAVSGALLKIRELCFESRRLSPAAVFTAITKKMKLFSRFDTDNLEYFYFALELVREKTACGEIDSVYGCSLFLGELLSGESGEERCLSLKKEQNRIHIANLHKVKGLEAAIVILAAQGRKKNKNSERVEYSDFGADCYLFSVKATGKKEIKNKAHKNEQAREEISQDAEILRLLYVAATRARNVLIVGDPEKGRGVTHAWTQLVDRVKTDIWDVIKGSGKEESVKAVCDVSDLYGKAKNVIKDSSSGDASYEIRLPSTMKLKSIIKEDEDSENSETQLRQKAKKDPALLGTVIHRLMEVLVTSRGKMPLDDAVKSICSEYGAEDIIYHDTMKSVGERIENGGYEQSNGMTKDILSLLHSADEVHCEVPFCYAAEDSVIWNGVIDVAYRKDGSWHIVDYKTNSDGAELDEKYNEQLEAYKTAFRKLTGEEADAYIYHIDC